MNSKDLTVAAPSSGTTDSATVRYTIIRDSTDEAREALKEAEKNDVQAFQAAVNNGGWTADELKKIGLAAPDKVQRVQRRRKATSTSPDAHASSAQNGSDTKSEQ